MMKKIITSLIIVLVSIVVLSNLLVWYLSRQHNYSSIKDVPSKSYGILFGTGRSSTPSPYYEARVQAAVELLQAEKIAVLIISGENQYADYNEVDSMAADILRAVPDAVLSLDYAGTDTYASLQNAGDIFGYRADYTLISQHFHNQRALFYACFMMSGNVYAYDATDTHSIGWRARNTVREIFARTKAILLVPVVLLKS